MKKSRPPRVLPPATRSDALLVEIAPRSVGMFRFLLEGYDHLAGFTVLNRHTALLKVFFSPHQREEVTRMLEGVCRVLGAQLKPWPAAAVPPMGSDRAASIKPAGASGA